eukprot:comp22478_c0_seq1/m.33887 comp22478_c0_seq1/g.33887  ORF comp22478_c0_seq1/g.33887 comp22478_c0_seq1/m.33887 type:complete len:1148 (-) comp22478_c0_seq1:453-3896(-)
MPGEGIGVGGLDPGRGAKHFRLTVGTIRALLESTHEHAVEALNEIGGVDTLAAALHVNLHRGIASDDPEDHQSRIAAYGENHIPVPPPKTLLQLMWDALQDPILIILMVAGVVSLILGVTFEEDKSTGWIEGFAILVAVLVVTLVASLNDYQKERQFRKLNAVKEDYKISVIRDGQSMQISKFGILVGDIALLGQGDEIEADGVVVEVSSLKVNEASLTGESDDIKKSTETAPFLYSGTQVMDGVGKMLVLAVGENSQSGIITALINGKKSGKPEVGNTNVAAPLSPGAIGKKEPELNVGSTIDVQPEDEGATYVAMVPNERAVEAKPVSGEDELDSKNEEEEENETILQRKLTRLATMIGYLGLAVGVLTFLALVVRFCVEEYGIKERPFVKSDLNQFLHYLIIGITVLVVAIPEGLPLAVTLSLAFSMKQMLKENNLVRHLDACETMGSATTICSDKTGTLTMNRMTVMRAFVAQTETDRSDLKVCGVSPPVTACLFEGIATNSTAEVKVPASGVGVPEHIGSKTECALLQYMILEQGIDYNQIRSAHKPLVMYPFSSARKSSGAVVASTLMDGTSGYRLHIKGASEMVLGRCTRMLLADGHVGPLTDQVRREVLARIESYARESLRTLVLAYREFTDNRDWETVPAEEIDCDLIMICVVGIEDPVRPEVPGAIEKCGHAGIAVRMVTGDNVITATAIAKKCGILTSDRDLVMEGPEFRRRVLDNEGKIRQIEMDKIWPRLRVLARSSPTDKYTLVSGILQSKISEQVVAVTGDGTNDAPALKRADVGFAMGIQGTSVAKNASDIILMDDNFNSIVVAVKWGRNVYDSIAKFVQFQLTVNFVALIVAFVSACIVRQSPLTATQLLWINLVMDTLASLALATERPTDALLDRKPYGRNKSLISRRMWLFVLGHSLYQIVILFWMAYASYSFFGIPNGKGQDRSVHYTMVFNTFALCQFFNEINARKLHGELNVFKGIHRNPYYVVIMVLQFVVQILLVQFGSHAFKVMPLNLEQWGWCILFGALELPWNMVLHLMPKIIPKSWKVKMTGQFARSRLVRRRQRFRTVNGFSVKRDGRHPDSLHPQMSIRELVAKAQPPSFYETTLQAVINNSTSEPSARLRAAARLVTYRVKAELEEERRGIAEGSS